MEELAIGSVLVSALIFGIAEFAKDKLGFEGKSVVALVAALGVLFTGLSVSITLGYIPPEIATWVESIVTALVSILSAMGYYAFQKRRKNGY